MFLVLVVGEDPLSDWDVQSLSSWLRGGEVFDNGPGGVAMRLAMLPIGMISAMFGVFLAIVSPMAAAPVSKAVVETYEGYVDGIDVIANQGQPVLCLAFINKENQPGSEYIQVTTTEGRLQSALETASIKRVRVEVSYSEDNGQKKLNRVRLLDRGEILLKKQVK